MATKVFMEALSPTMEEGRLVKWLKNEGDAVKSGDVLAEVETDKAVMELAARGAGVLRKRLVNEGEAVPVGTLVGVIASAAEDISALVGAPKTGDGRSKTEDAGSKMEDGRSKAPAAPAPAPAAPPSSISPSSIAVPPSSRSLSSPLAKRLASESGLDLASVAGSGPGGRIIKRDIEAALATGSAGGGRPSSSIFHPTSSIDFEDLPLTLIRKTIARRLAESIGPIPTFYLTAEFDLERASEMRAAMALPRIRIAVKASPIMPANIGVKPSNSITTSAASGRIRYQLSRMACQGLGHWSFGMPSSFRRPASRCTMTKAVK